MDIPEPVIKGLVITMSALLTVFTVFCIYKIGYYTGVGDTYRKAERKWNNRKFPLDF